jgi:hypothetical protein
MPLAGRPLDLGAGANSELLFGQGTFWRWHTSPENLLQLRMRA